MDIDKLEKLSCLKLSHKDKGTIENSLNGVFSMMAELDSIECEITKDKALNPTIYRVESTNEKMIEKNQPINGLHKEDSFFLAPKVIKK